MNLRNIVIVGILLTPAHGNAASWIYTSPTSLGLPSDIVTALHEDKGGQIWVGTGLAGIGVFDGDGWNVYELGLGQARTPIISIASDLRGTIWAIDRNGIGLSRYSEGVWNTWTGSVITSVADKRAMSVGTDCYAQEFDFHSMSAEPEISSGVPFV